MTTVADVLAKTRNDYLMTGARDQRNLLAADITSGATTLTFTYELASIAVGAKVSVGLEDMYVYDSTPASKSAVVSRGDFGTTGVAHSSGAVALVNARFTDAQILRAVNDELNSLSSAANGLYRVLTADFTFNAAVSGYDLTGASDVLSVIDVRYQAVGSDADWPLLDRDLWRHERDLSTAVFASGQALFLRDYVDPGRTVRATYRAPFSASLAAYTDDVLTVSGLPVSAHDILSLGAAIRLTAGLEIRRDQIESQGDTRRADEVPVGANLGANRGLQQARLLRIREEAARLQQMYPPKLG